MSFATLERMNDRDWRRDSLLSLAGVFASKREGVVPVALEQYLKTHPGIRHIHLHLDNDEVGKAAAKGIPKGLDGTTVSKNSSAVPRGFSKERGVVS